MPDSGENPVGAVILLFVPKLVPIFRDIPVLGRIFRLIAPAGAMATATAEQTLEEAAREARTSREERIKRNARYVLKASDAMQCVEDNIMNGQILVTIGKLVIDRVTGGSESLDSIITDRVFACIESKVLAQTGVRKKKTKKYYGRPAKGHGRGRK